jgi:hypothetical protein
VTRRTVAAELAARVAAARAAAVRALGAARRIVSSAFDRARRRAARQVAMRAHVAIALAVRAVDVVVAVAGGHRCGCEQPCGARARERGSRSEHHHLGHVDSRHASTLTNAQHVLSRSRPILAALAALRAITTMRPVREDTHGTCRWCRA